MIAVPRTGAFVCWLVPSELAALLLVLGEGGQIAAASWGDAPASPSGTSALVYGRVCILRYFCEHPGCGGLV